MTSRHPGWWAGHQGPDGSSGGLLRAVPGTPYLMAGGSLYKLMPDGQVKGVNAGYYSPSSSGSGQLAFFGRPATHAINQVGASFTASWAPAATAP